jgi:hypothetical protein
MYYKIGDISNASVDNYPTSISKTNKILLYKNNIHSIFKLRLDTYSADVFDHDNQMISLLKGKIIKSSGFNNDFEYLFNESSTNNLFIDGVSSSVLVRFFNPETSYLMVELSYTEVKINKDTSKKLTQYINDNSFKAFEERFYVKKINWSGVNYYILNDKGNVIYSRQYLDPLTNKSVVSRYIN